MTGRHVRDSLWILLLSGCAAASQPAPASDASEGDASGEEQESHGSETAETTAAASESAGEGSGVRSESSSTQEDAASTEDATSSGSTSAPSTEESGVTTSSSEADGTTIADLTSDETAAPDSGTSDPRPSPGCGGGAANVEVPNTIVTLPEDYDPSIPSPLVFGFHGATRTNVQFQTVDAGIAGSDLERNYIMAYVQSSGSQWDWALGDLPRVDAAYDAITNAHCVDLDRVFATGHSSGAQFITGLLCDGEDRFRAVAPVASSERDGCSWGAIPTLLIHGTDDDERPDDRNGQAELPYYIDANGCGASAAYPSDLSCTRGATAVDPGCVEFEGCAAPLVWCNHNDPHYNETNHGWPCFATRAIFEFFEAQR